MRLRVSVQGRERAGHWLVGCLPGVLGIARLDQLLDQLGAQPPRLHLRHPLPAQRRAVLGLAPRTLAGRLGFVEDRNDSSSSA